MQATYFLFFLFWRKSLKIISNLKLSLPTWKKLKYICTKYMECMSNHVVGIYCVYLYCFLRSYVLIQVALTCTLDNITVKFKCLNNICLSTLSQENCCHKIQRLYRNCSTTYVNRVHTTLNIDFSILFLISASRIIR